MGQLGRIFVMLSWLLVFIPHACVMAEELDGTGFTFPGEDPSEKLVEMESPDALSETSLHGMLEQSKQIMENLERANELAAELQVRLGRVWSVGSYSHSPANAAVAAPAGMPNVGKVYLIVAADTRPMSGGTANAIRSGTRNNADTITRLVKGQTKAKFNGADVDILARSSSLLDSNFNRQRLLSEIQGVPSTVDDVIFVYIACHGAFAVPSNFPVFQMPLDSQHASGTSDRLISRREIISALAAKQSRQWILISDSCASTIRATPQLELAEVATAFPSEPTTNALAKLLFFHRGSVDINGCSPAPATMNDRQENANRGQIGIYSTGSDASGYFTSVFARACLCLSKDPPSWSALLNDSNRRLNETVKFGVQVNGISGPVTRQTAIHFSH
ncbi:hypothetical protein [Planctomicrobium piriforme]|nr:hypothetical protein [Planctomicrobium piriforme]